MVIRIEQLNKINGTQLFLIIGMGIFFAGTIGLMTRYLSHGNENQEH
jgi:hypothetical protein